MGLMVHDHVSRKDLCQKSQEERYKITWSPPSKGFFFFPTITGLLKKPALQSRAILGRIIAQATVISSQICNAQSQGITD